MAARQASAAGTIPARGAKDRHRLYFWLILCAGILARVVLFGIVPGGVNQDEAFAGYEAYSLLHYGIDSEGYPFPVYFTAWGTGMNALESYLMIPFIALFGLKVWVIRLPQLIVSLFSLWVLYLTVRRTHGEHDALTAMFLLAICPWHVLMSRWGLESNLAPGFLLFGFYFFLRGLEDSRFFLLSALMYGLSLYAYATIWVIVPLIVLLQLLYTAAHKKIRADRRLVLSGVILLVFAAPLVLFLLVNHDIIGEIRTPFLSVPRLVHMRTGEVTLTELPWREWWMLSMLLRQWDGLFSNSAGIYGLLYPITPVFVLLGLGVSLRRLWRGRRAFCPDAFLLIHLLLALLLGGMIYVNVNRINIIFIPLILYAAIGVRWFGGLVRGYMPAVLAAYILLFAAFQAYYFTSYRYIVGCSFDEGLDKAVAYAEDAGEDIYFDDYILHSKLLFYTEVPPDRFLRERRTSIDEDGNIVVSSFGRYHFGIDPKAIDPDAAYVVFRSSELEPRLWEALGFRVHEFGTFDWYFVAYPPAL